LSISLAVELEEITPDGPVHYFARVKVRARCRARSDRLGAAGQRWFVMLEDIMRTTWRPVPGLRVTASYLFRVTRDADLDLQEDEADDLLRAVESELRKRRFGETGAARGRADDAGGLAPQLARRSSSTAAIVTSRRMMGTESLWTLVNIEEPDCTIAVHAGVSQAADRQTDMFAAILKAICCAPSVRVVRPGRAVRAAGGHRPQRARDSADAVPHVRQLAGGGALVDAAGERKQVAALIELKARFDEENNIHWARMLERSGPRRLRLAGLKTHAKVTLVVRDEPDGIRRYMHFGTGNYNDKTARTYTDLSLFTCRADLGADATQLFNALTGFSRRTATSS